MISIWLTKSRAMDEALRKYETSSTLPEPEALDWDATGSAAPNVSRASADYRNAKGEKVRVV
jgi:hypothetical protein